MWSLIEVIYVVLYAFAGVCFLGATLRRPGPGAAAKWNLVGLGLLLVVAVKIMQLIDANT